MRNDVVDQANIETELLDLVAEEAMVERDILVPDALLDDLDIASADFVMILMAIEERFGVYISVDEELSNLKTVQDLLTLATKRISEAEV